MKKNRTGCGKITGCGTTGTCFFSLFKPDAFNILLIDNNYSTILKLLLNLASFSDLKHK